MAKKRVPVMMEEELKLWCVMNAERYGMPISSFINMCVMQFKQNSEALETMKDMTVIYDKLESIEAKLNNAQV